MFVSKLMVTAWAVLCAVSLTGKTLDANYNPSPLDTLNISQATTTSKAIPTDEGSIISLCNLVPEQRYSVEITPPETDCYPLIELFDKATTSNIRKWRDHLRDGFSPNTKFTFVATSSCMDVLLDRNDCSLAKAFEIKVSSISNRTEVQNEIFRNMGITTDANRTADELVNDVLVGGGCFEIVPGSISAIGNPQGIGYFQGGENSIGLEDGVILSTGEIANSSGPNNYDATSGYLGVNGEEDLERLMPGTFIYDASGIEFSFVPTTDRIEFRYVFASEEYCEFVASRFNDVFGFFIQGPGINGGFTGNGENIALIPGTNSRVSINSVNHVLNRPYYVKNETLEDAIDCFIPYNPQALNQVEYDGFTIALTATAEVIPCETYTIKLVVSDVSDRRLDSAVFLEANSFEAGGQAEVSTDVPYNSNNIAYESCQSSFFRFDRVDEDLDEPLVIKYKLSDMSTAELGVDFAAFPDSIIIPAGDTTFLLPVEIFEDDIIEGSESIVIELENPCSCDAPFTLMTIIDKPVFSALGLDQVICNKGTVDLSVAITGGVEPFSYLWSTDDETPIIEVTPDDNNTYMVTITDFCGEVAIESIDVQVLPEPVAELAGSGQICPESPVAGLPINFTGTGPFTLTYAINGVMQDPIQNISNNDFTLSAGEIGIYTLISMADNGCPGPVQGQAEIVTTEIELETETTPVTCFDRADGTIDLSLSGNGIAPFKYAWTSGSNMEDPINLPEGEYAVLIEDANGCTASTTANIILDPEVPIAMAAVDDILTCDETRISLDGTGSSTESFYTYNWQTTEGNVLEGQTSLSPVINQAGTYNLIVTNSKTNCSISAEILAEADIEAPDVELTTLTPQSVIDCNFPAVVLDGISDEPINSLEFFWTTTDGLILSGVRTPNPEVGEGGVYNLQLTNQRNGCVTNEQITIETNTDIPNINITDPDLFTCVNKEVEIDATSSAQGNEFTYEWTSPDGNFITDANTLLAKIREPGDYNLKIVDNSNGCENTELVVVMEDITPPEVEIASPEIIICDRPVVALNGSESSTGDNFTYRWTTRDGNLMESTNKIVTEVDKGGTYVLEVTNIENGCISSKEILVEENTNRPTDMELTATPPKCFGDVGMIEIGAITGGEGPFLYSYDGGNSFGSATLNPTTPSGDYNIVILDINGCELSQNVTVPPTFKLEVALDPETIIELGDEHELNAITNISSTEIADIEWVTEDSLSCTQCLNPSVAPIQSMTYNITIRDLNGCTASANTVLRVDRTPVVYIPNVFSPNNADGINDRFVVYGKEGSIRQINTFQIFNRWGGKLFEMNDFQPNDDSFGWDGRDRGQRLSPAVFVYFVEIEFIDGRTELFEGDVVIID